PVQTLPPHAQLLSPEYRGEGRKCPDGRNYSCTHNDPASMGSAFSCGGPTSLVPILHACRYHKRLAIGALQQAIGFLIVNARFRRGIEADGSAGAEGDIAEMAHAGAHVSYFDVGIGPAYRIRG